MIFEGHTRDQGDIEPNKGSYGPQNVYHGMKYLAKSCKFSPDVCMYIVQLSDLDIYRFSSVPRLPPAHASIWLWIDKNSFVSRNKYAVADYDDSQFIIDLQGLLH